MKNFINFYFLIRDLDLRKTLAMLLCVDMIKLHSLLEFVAEICRA